MSKSKDVSPAQDGGILKEITKAGQGAVTPSYGSEASSYHFFKYIKYTGAVIRYKNGPAIRYKKGPSIWYIGSNLCIFF